MKKILLGGLVALSLALGLVAGGFHFGGLAAHVAGHNVPALAEDCQAGGSTPC